GSALGRKPAPPVTLRGFFGMTLEEGDEAPVVKGVLEKGPAGAAGLKVNDVLTKVEGRTVTNVADVLRVLGNANKLKAGSSIKLTVKRDKDTKEITFKIGEGLYHARLADNRPGAAAGAGPPGGREKEAGQAGRRAVRDAQVRPHGRSGEGERQGAVSAHLRYRRADLAGEQQAGQGLGPAQGDAEA